MTKEVIDYSTRNEMKIGKKQKHSQGSRPLHTDFINNDESQGYRVTFVKGIDDPDNSPEIIAKRATEKTRLERLRALQIKLKDDTIDFRELKEYTRLKDRV